MFDDQPLSPNSSQPPKNLPMGEPQDIFEGTEGGVQLPPPPLESMNPSSSSAPISTPSTALGAGILKPKVPTSAPTYDTPPVLPSENAIKEPKLSRGIMMTIMGLVIAFVLVGSGWFIYHTFFAPKAQEVAPLVTAPVVTPSTEPVVDSAAVSSVDTTQTTSSDAVDREIIVGETPDTDGDGLKDDREKELGTDPENWDTDTDDLSDGEEVLIWHTNPKNADTDGDTYKDGAEVKAGYNPSGPGRLAEITSSTSTPVATTSSTTPPTSVGTSGSTTSTSSVSSTPPSVSSSSSSFQIEL